MRLSQDPTTDTVAKLGAVAVAMFAFVFVVMVSSPVMHSLLLRLFPQWLLLPGCVGFPYLRPALVFHVVVVVVVVIVVGVVLPRLRLLAIWPSMLLSVPSRWVGSS